MIRQEYATGAASRRELASRYGVSRPMIHYIVSGHSWRGSPAIPADHIPSLPGEQWADIRGFPTYQASTLQRVKRVPHAIEVGGATRVRRARLVPCHVDRFGYVKVSLRRSDSQMASVGLHRLMALAFIGDIPAGFEVCHNDSNPLNNTIENLRIDTPTGNASDKIARGTSGRSLSVEQVDLCRRAYRDRMIPSPFLARIFGVSKPVMVRALRGDGAYSRCLCKAPPITVLRGEPRQRRSTTP